jgi:hypothetical protein
VAHKAFKARQGAEEITFDFDGQIFRCVPVLDVDTMTTVAAAIYSNDVGAAMIQIMPFFNSCLVEDDATETQGSSLERFQEVLHRKTNRLDLETLTEIMQWLTEQYTGRPTQRPADSSAGPSSTGPSLKAVSSSPDIPPTVPYSIPDSLGITAEDEWPAGAI